MRTNPMRFTALKFTASLPISALAGPAFAATCQNTGSFDAWLAAFKKDAVAQGISPQVVAAASPDMTFDQAIVRRDRGQAVFGQTFLQFSDRMVANFRMQNRSEERRVGKECRSRWSPY